MNIVQFAVSNAGVSEACDMREHDQEDFILRVNVDVDLLGPDDDLDHILSEVFLDRREMDKYPFIIQ